MEERRKTKVDVKRAPSDTAKPTLKEDAFEDIDEDSWLKELLLQGAADATQIEPEVPPMAKGVSEVMVKGPEPPPEVTDGPLRSEVPETLPLRPIVKGRTLLKKDKGRSSEASARVPTVRRAVRTSGPPPVRPRKVRKAMGKGATKRSPLDPAALMEEIDITGTQNSPQKLLLDAIDTIDQLLEESEISVTKDQSALQKAQKKRP